MVRKNWFSYVVIALFEAGMFFALLGGIWIVGDSEQLPYLVKGGIVLSLAVLWLLFSGALAVFAKIRTHSHLRMKGRGWLAAELVIVTALIAAGTYLRLWVIQNLPMQPLSDFKTYYEIADMLSRGTLLSEGAGYCDYIAQFPHVIGFPFVLSTIFRVTGKSVEVGQFFELFVSCVNILLVYLLARSLRGRLAGLIAATLEAFWPSQIFYANQISSEPVFTLMILVCLLLAAHLLKERSSVKWGQQYVLYVLLGVLLALSSALRPLGIIILVAILICILCSGGYIKSPNLTSANKNILEKGWMRALVVLFAFMLCSSATKSCIASTIDRQPASSTSSFGYNLLVGMNIDSIGTWDQSDSTLFSDTFKATGSADSAHQACLSLAIQRMEENPIGILNLMAEKYFYLWRFDDYGIQWNLLFMDQQGTLTPELKNMLNNFLFINDIYYIFVLSIAAIAGFFLWRRRKGSRVQMLMLIFLGTATAHLFMESQNRYLYHVLPIFAVMAAVGIAEQYDVIRNHKLAAIGEQLSGAIETKLAAEKLEFEAVHSEIPEMFDIVEAIKAGHVTVSVSEAYLTEKPDESADENQEKGSGISVKKELVGEVR